MSSEWQSKRLGDCCLKIGSGATPKGGKDVYLDSGPVRLIRSQNIYNEGFSPSGLAFISEEQAKKLDNVSVLAGDVLLNITGDSVARVCQAPAAYLPARVNQHVAIIRADPNTFDARYLRYFLASPAQQDLMLGLAAASTRQINGMGYFLIRQLPTRFLTGLFIKPIGSSSRENPCGSCTPRSGCWRRNGGQGAGLPTRTAFSAP